MSKEASRESEDKSMKRYPVGTLLIIAVGSTLFFTLLRAAPGFASGFEAMISEYWLPIAVVLAVFFAWCIYLIRKHWTD